MYLQFDGFEASTYEALRGRSDLLDTKLAALANLEAAGARVVLVATIVKGVNDHEIGAVVRFGAEHPAVRAVSLQPQFGEGRFVAFDAMDRMTITDVIDGGRSRQRAVHPRGLRAGAVLRPDVYGGHVCVRTRRQGHPGDASGAGRDLPRLPENSAMPNLSEAYREDMEEMRDVLLRLYSKRFTARHRTAGERVLLRL